MIIDICARAFSGRLRYDLGTPRMTYLSCVKREFVELPFIEIHVKCDCFLGIGKGRSNVKHCMIWFMVSSQLHDLGSKLRGGGGTRPECLGHRGFACRVGRGPIVLFPNQNPTRRVYDMA